MIRRTQRARRDQRRAHEEMSAGLDHQDRGQYRPPHRDDCSERSWFQSVDDADTIRIDHRLFRCNGKLVDFAIVVLAVDLDGRWVERARADCCHGHVHLHHTNGSVSSIAPLHRVEDVDRSFEQASDRVFEYAITIRDMKGRREHDA
ncbi:MULTISPECIES: hypothetical protein [Curtobacterium]|nr:MULTISPECIES: hypothetical protein [Curtobacterium]UBQ01834.1 hypothetical protein LCG91_12265 [Curtobacterium sp. TXMA1]